MKTHIIDLLKMQKIPQKLLEVHLDELLLMSLNEMSYLGLDQIPDEVLGSLQY